MSCDFLSESCFFQSHPALSEIFPVPENVFLGKSCLFGSKCPNGQAMRVDVKWAHTSQRRQGRSQGTWLWAGCQKWWPVNGVAAFSQRVHTRQRCDLHSWRWHIMPHASRRSMRNMLSMLVSCTFQLWCAICLFHGQFCRFYGLTLPRMTTQTPLDCCSSILNPQGLPQ